MTQNGIDDLYGRVIEYLESISDAEKVRLSRRWDKGDDYETYGLSAADYTALYEAFNPRFKSLALEERFELADRWASTGNRTLIHLGIHLLRLSAREGLLDPTHFDFLDTFTESFQSWGNVDTFCAGVIQPLLEEYPEDVIALLRRWNASPSPMKRRTSVVTFTRKTAESGRYVDLTLELCGNLIWDTEDLVRKGVGWALKDTMRADRPRIVEYVKDLRRRGVSSTITLYAIRDLKGEERREVLEIKARKKGPNN
jgi:3-methyladenine DNA glycosylase AlkD